MADSFIELSNVTLQYGGGTLALAQTDLRIPQGDFVALVGPSGCGLVYNVVCECSIALANVSKQFNTETLIFSFPQDNGVEHRVAQQLQAIDIIGTERHRVKSHVSKLSHTIHSQNSMPGNKHIVQPKIHS